MHLDLRLESLERLEDMGGFPGYGIGGYSVGEPHDMMFETLPDLAAAMPANKPRYLMGLETPPRCCGQLPLAWTCSTACSPHVRLVWVRRFQARAGST